MLILLFKILEIDSKYQNTVFVCLTIHTIVVAVILLNGGSKI